MATRPATLLSLSILGAVLCAALVGLTPVANGQNEFDEDPTLKSVLSPQPVTPDPAADIVAGSFSTTAETPEERIAALEEQVQLLRDELRNLQDLLAGEVGQDFTDKLLGAMPQSEDLRRQLGTATQGRINIVNSTGREVHVFINGTRWLARVDDSYIYAPVGKVSFQETLNGDPTFQEDWRMKDGILQMTYFIGDSTRL